MTHGTSPAIQALFPVLAQATGSCIREARVSLGLRQSKFAAQIGVSGPQMSRLETGRVCPTLPAFFLIAYGAAVPPGQLLARVNENPAVRAAMVRILTEVRILQSPGD